MSVRGQRINLAFDSFKMTKARNEEPPAADFIRNNDKISMTMIRT